MKTLKQIFLTLAASLLCAGCQEVDEPANTIPTVKTDEVTELGATGAYLNGTVSSEEGECYFLVSASPDMGDAWEHWCEIYYDADKGVRFCHAYEGDLQPATTYYVMLCVTDGRSTVNGNIVQFTTLSYLSIESAKFGGELPGEEIGVYLTNADNKVWNKNYGNMDAWLNGGYSFKLPYDITLTESAYKVYAYAPYSKENSATSINAINVRIDGRTNYLYGSCDVTPQNSKANIEMKSALAKLVFEITSESEEDIVFSYINLRNPNDNGPITLEGTLDLGTGIIKPTAIPGNDGIIMETADNTVRAGKTVTVEMLVIPTTFEDGEVLANVCVGGQVYGTNLPTTTWEAGKQYTYNVNLNVGKLTIGTVTVEEWNNNDGGTIHINQ